MIWCESVWLCMQAIRTLDGAEWQGRRLGVERARNVKYAPILSSLRYFAQQHCHDALGLRGVGVAALAAETGRASDTPSGTF